MRPLLLLLATVSVFAAADSKLRIYELGKLGADKLEQRMADAPEAIAPRASSRLLVRRERAGCGGKVVTIVEGEPLRGCELPALAKDLARAMGTGARVESGTLVLQGEQIERVVAWLVSRGLGPIVVGN